MKMAFRVTQCFAALLLTVTLAATSVSAVQRLKSITALKKLDFGRSVPSHILVLLFWFAEEVDIQPNSIRLTFDPDDGDFCSHEYYNYEGLLEPLPRGQQYYTIGNLNQDTSMPFPSYVSDTQFQNETPNRDRIIIRVNRGSIDQVYITQHHDQQGTEYDPYHTYHITANLLRQIREFSDAQNSLEDLTSLRNKFGSNANISHIRNTWGKLASLGLFLLIVMTTTSNNDQQKRRPENRHFPDTAVNIPSSNDDFPVYKDNNFQQSRRPENRQTHDIYVNMASSSVGSQALRDSNNRRCRCLCCVGFLFIIGIIVIILVLVLPSIK